MNLAPTGSTLPGVTHHRVALNGAELHYVAAGRAGPPILLVHGFPETWWAFHKLIPLLVRSHRVFAVDLRGFGDSSHEPGDYDSATVAEDLYRLIKHLDVGRVHVVGQDISGTAVFRLVASHPDDIASLTAIEMGLAGFGLEKLADVTHGGACWHIGVMAAAGIPEMLLAGHEREFIAWLFNSMSANPSAIGGADIEEFARSYSRPEGWRGATGLYQSMLREGAEIKAIAETGALKMPVLAIGAGGGTFTVDTISKVASGPVRSVRLQCVGHYAALEAPDEVASAIADFVASGDGVSG